MQEVNNAQRQIQQQLPHATLARPLEQGQYEQRARLEAVALPGGEAAAASIAFRITSQDGATLQQDGTAAKPKGSVGLVA